MRGTRVGSIVLAAFVAGCSTTGTGHGVSVSPTGPPSPSPTTSPSPSPDSTPPPDGPLTTGAAAVTVSGDLTAQVGFPTLSEPDVWSVPPGPMDLQWTEPGGRSLQLSGTSFASRAVTSADRVLTLTIDGPDGTVGFSSSAGECTITITPALPETVGGVFTCSSLVDTTGAFTVQASGNFSASA
jgi:hypothetical protein